MAPLVEVHFSADHATAAGHFPGNPIIPGALLLDEIVQVLAGEAAGGPVVIRSAKFFHPVRPGESMRVVWQGLGGGALRFECHLADGNTLVAAGIVETGQGAS